MQKLRKQLALNEVMVGQWCCQYIERLCDPGVETRVACNEELNRVKQA